MKTIIFGSTSGIGRAFRDEDTTSVNRSIIDLSVIISPHDMEWLKTLFKSHPNASLVLNASTIEPIGMFGDVKDSDLVGAAYTNFLNYERIINLFLSVNMGKILVMSSGSVDCPNPTIASYCATKSALESLVKSLFRGGVRIIAFRPPATDTGLHSKLKKDVPLATPESVAKKMHQIINNDDYWTKPIINWKEI